MKNHKNGQRLIALDVMRGMTVAGMILVNSSSNDSFSQLLHSEWNGLTLCDLVFPFFLFIMGMSIHLSLYKNNFTATKPVVYRILKRTALLFLIGLAINYLALICWDGTFSLHKLRIWAVLQRIAICYGIVSLFTLTVNHRYTLPTVFLLLAFYAAILIIGNGYSKESAMNIIFQIDNMLFGYNHLYHEGPVDPEGLLGIIPSAAHTLIGFWGGMQLQAEQGGTKKIVKGGMYFLIMGLLLALWLPLNKRIWSPSFVLVTCGLAILLFVLLIYTIDRKGWKHWISPFLIFGTNPLFLYVGSEVLAIVCSVTGVSGMMDAFCRQLILSPSWAALVYALLWVYFMNLLGYPLWRHHIFIKL